MIKSYLLILLTLVLTCTHLQGQNEVTDLFAPLLGHSWRASGQWGDGSPFYQEIRFETNLEGQMVVAYSNGYVDQDQSVKGERNIGLRRWDSAQGKFLFWEYDVFGGLTTGTISNEGKSIRYNYTYGELKLTDQWEYIDDNTYGFKVGQWDGQNWTATYLDTTFKKVEVSPIANIFKTLKMSLPGKWQSKAWDGLLDEHWWVDADGNLRQTASYSENGVVSYKAKNKIELIDDQLVLISLIEGSDPRVFQATFFDDKQVVFFNSMYENPSRVTYLIEDGSFQRIIGGMEDGKPSRYTFNFNKTN